MKNLIIGQEVNYVAPPEKEGGKTSIKKGFVFNLAPFQIDLTLRKKNAKGEDEPSDPDKPLGSNLVQATHSLGGEAGTFHLPSETKAVKAADTFGETPATESNPAPVVPGGSSAPPRKS